MNMLCTLGHSLIPDKTDRDTENIHVLGLMNSATKSGIQIVTSPDCPWPVAQEACRRDWQMPPLETQAWPRFNS